MSHLIEWEPVCLVCLQNGENRCIFEEDNDSIVIAEKIMKYSDILIKRDTNQPKSICLQCLDDLNVASKFHRNYEQSESIIKALLNTNHQEIQIKDLWKTSSTTVNPILGICIKVEVMDNNTVDSCEKTPCLNLEDNAGTESKPIVEDRADCYVNSNTTELNNMKTVQNIKSRQAMNYKIPRRSRGRQKILSDESSFTSGYKRPLKHPRVRPKQSTGVSSKICEICNRDLKTQNGLNIHMRRHNNVRPFSCDSCDKTFVTRSELQSHVRVHTGEKPYKCQYCDLRFFTNEVKKSHESDHTGEKPFKCLSCDKSYGYSKSLKVHLRTHNKSTCKKFRREKPFKNHANRHLNRVEVNNSSELTEKKSLEKEIFQIQENTNSNEVIIKHEIVEDDLIGDNYNIESTPCIDEEYDTASEATNREIPKQSTGVSPKICEICNRDFKTQDGLNVHMRRHNNERPFSCDHCDKAFVTRSALRSHIRVHTGEKLYKCQYCDLGFSDRNVKDNHESKHTGVKPFKCPTCNKSFGYPKGLKVHLRIHNKSTCKEFRREKPFKKHTNRHLSEVNNSSELTEKKSLEKEIFQIQENTNSNEVIIKHEIVEDDLIGDNCNIGSTPCIDEEYDTASEATNGEIPRQSTGVSLKICEICNHRFRHQSALEIHMRRHNNVRPFSCDHCDKAFVTRATLRYHIRVHTGEKPYKCQYCDLRFSTKVCRHNHETKHTGVKPFKCPTCDKSYGYSQGLIGHLRFHNSKNKNKFSCKKCGEEFTQKLHFQGHVAQHLTENELDKSSEHEQKKRLEKEIDRLGDCVNSKETRFKHEELIEEAGIQ